MKKNTTKKFHQCTFFKVLSVILILANAHLSLTFASTPKSTNENLNIAELLSEALKPYDYLKVEVHKLTFSSRNHLVIKSATPVELPQDIIHWLIEQQGVEKQSVVSYGMDEYLITESDATPTYRKTKMCKWMGKQLKPSSLFNLTGIKSTVNVKFLVNDNGDIEKLHSTVLDSSLNDFEKKILHVAARKAIMSTSGYWNPATVDGKTVKKWIYWPVEFKIKKNKTLVRLLR